MNEQKYVEALANAMRLTKERLASSVLDAAFYGGALTPLGLEARHELEVEFDNGDTDNTL